MKKILKLIFILSLLTVIFVACNKNKGQTQEPTKNNENQPQQGQNYDYELNEIFFVDLNVRKPDYFLNAAGINAAKTIGLVIANIDDRSSIANADLRNLLISPRNDLGDINKTRSSVIQIEDFLKKNNIFVIMFFI